MSTRASIEKARAMKRGPENGTKWRLRRIETLLRHRRLMDEEIRILTSSRDSHEAWQKAMRWRMGGEPFPTSR